MSRVVIIGAGPMGLAAAYQGVKDGHEVTVLEAGPQPGGMAAHFDFGGISLERFYHFVCRSDQPTFDLMAELGIADKMRWIPTSMGLYMDGRLHEWGNPIALLRLPGISPLMKLRYGLFGFVCTRRKSWPSLENQSAREWIIRWCGQRCYDLLWRPLFDLKFYQYANDISAAWMWTRMRRLWRSRRSLMQEELGYIEGGSATLVSALAAAIEQGGGSIRLGSVAHTITVEGERVTGVDSSYGHVAADLVISTVPIPYVVPMIPALPITWKQRYEAINTVGICCVILKLRRPVSRHFWVNLTGTPHDLPGFIEFSNLRPVGTNIVYAPYYMPTTNEKFSWPDQRLIDDAFLCLQMVNPALTREDLIAANVSRLRHSQVVCPPGFKTRLPPIQTPIRGLQVADTCFYYPEDRSIAESVRLGRSMARSLRDISTEKDVDLEPAAAEKVEPSGWAPHS
jgi:protoporphyrinogen oxidase